MISYESLVWASTTFGWSNKQKTRHAIKGTKQLLMTDFMLIHECHQTNPDIRIFSLRIPED
jgi:hypothetical protein